MSEKKNTGKKAVIAVIVIALIVVIIALAVVISNKSKKGGSKSATEAGTESGSETMRSGQFDIDYAKQVTKLADYSGVAITVSNDYEINDAAKQTYLTNVLCIARVFTEFRECHKAHLKLSLFPKKVKHIESRQYL